MTTPRRRRALVPLVLAVAALSLGACMPTSRAASAHFPSCRIAVYDATSSPSRSTLRPYLAEVSRFTGMRFEWVGSAAEAKYGIVIRALSSSASSSVGGTYRQVYEGRGTRGEELIYGSIIEVRSGASAGIVRHELGHLFGLAHDPASPLMRPTPSPTATYSALQRPWTRDVARRSGC